MMNWLLMGMFNHRGVVQGCMTLRLPIRISNVSRYFVDVLTAQEKPFLMNRPNRCHNDPHRCDGCQFKVYSLE